MEACNIMSKDIPQEICLSWGDGRDFFADFDIIEPLDNKQRFFSSFMNNSLELNLKPIPVLDPYDHANFKKQATSFSHEHLNGKVCFRIRQKDMGNIEQLVDAFCTDYHITANNLSIIVDLLDDTSKTDYLKAVESLNQLKNINTYNHIIVAASAFPVDMSKINEENDTIERTEWLNWINNYSTKKYLRYPTFADYTIRHPIYNPMAEHYAPSATIKYTLPEKWLFLKGGKGKNEHYLANANTLIKTTSFYGASFSAGDNFIAKKGEHFIAYRNNPKIKGTGNAKQWIYAGINHHITLVADQLANFPDKANEP